MTAGEIPESDGRKITCAKSGGPPAGVARHLIERGFDPARLSVQSYAAFRPVLPNSDTEGRGANRRVEIRYYRDER